MLEGFYIGCDPEFVFINKESGAFVPASRLCSNPSACGTDGHNATGELRPMHARSSLALVANIRVALQDGMGVISDVFGDHYGMLAGHYKFNEPLGGHIHLSGFTTSDFRTYMLPKLEITHRALSQCIDNISERDMRSHSGNGYGFGGYDPYRHQGDNWWEYRVPGSWLLSPQIAFLNLWLAEASIYASKLRQRTPFEVLKGMGGEQAGCDGVIKFAEAITEVPDKDLFIKVADKVFSSLPIDWGKNFVPNWLERGGAA